MLIKKQLEIIEEFYPGIDNLTEFEREYFGEFKSLHIAQLQIAIRRKSIEKFQNVKVGYDQNEFGQYDYSAGGTEG